MVCNLLRKVGWALLLLSSLSGATLAQSRNALVIGNAAYENAPTLKTPVTDASIVAETLQAAGYDVTELHDVRQGDIGVAISTFLDKVAAGGADGTAFVYYSGHAAATGAISDDGDGEYSIYTGALVTLMSQPGSDMEKIV